MNVHVGTVTFINFDWERGVLLVYCLKTGTLLYELSIAKLPKA